MNTEKIIEQFLANKWLHKNGAYLFTKDELASLCNQVAKQQALDFAGFLQTHGTLNGSFEQIYDNRFLKEQEEK